MPEARCPKCGALFYGWALTEPENQTCPECGTKLEIYDEEPRLRERAKMMEKTINPERANRQEKTKNNERASNDPDTICPAAE